MEGVTREVMLGLKEWKKEIGRIRVEWREKIEELRKEMREVKEWEKERRERGDDGMLPLRRTRPTFGFPGFMAPDGRPLSSQGGRQEGRRQLADTYSSSLQL